MIREREGEREGERERERERERGGSEKERKEDKKGWILRTRSRIKDGKR